MKYSNLDILIPKLEYILGMKEAAGREQNVDDIAHIVIKLNDTDPIGMARTLKTLGFNPDISTLLDGYGRAYGMDWLEQYYVKNEKKIIEYQSKIY